MKNLAGPPWKWDDVQLIGTIEPIRGDYVGNVGLAAPVKKAILIFSAKPGGGMLYPVSRDEVSGLK